MARDRTRKQIRDEILDELLEDYDNPEDLLGKDGLLNQLSSTLSIRDAVGCRNPLNHAAEGVPFLHVGWLGRHAEKHRGAEIPLWRGFPPALKWIKSSSEDAW